MYRARTYTKVSPLEEVQESRPAEMLEALADARRG
jgi:hypothetical protein